MMSISANNITCTIQSNTGVINYTKHNYEEEVTPDQCLLVEAGAGNL